MSKPTAARQEKHSKAEEKKFKADEKKFKATGEEVLQELFHDMYRDRKAIYKVNFFRGMFFGLGSVIGGTIIIAIVIGVLTQLVDIPHIGEYFERLLRLLEQTQPPSSN